MPYIGTRIVDDAGITLLREWIENLGSHSNDLASLRAAITTSWLSSTNPRDKEPCSLPTMERSRAADPLRGGPERAASRIVPVAAFQDLLKLPVQRLDLEAAQAQGPSRGAFAQRSQFLDFIGVGIGQRCSDG